MAVVLYTVWMSGLTIQPEETTGAAATPGASRERHASPWWGNSNLAPLRIGDSGRVLRDDGRGGGAGTVVGGGGGEVNAETRICTESDIWCEFCLFFVSLFTVCGAVYVCKKQHIEAPGRTTLRDARDASLTMLHTGGSRSVLVYTEELRTGAAIYQLRA